MNSTEGLHGDLGIINPEDIVLAISNSGESDEIIAIMPAIKNIGAYIIAMTGNINSRLAKASDLYINTHVEARRLPYKSCSNVIYNKCSCNGRCSCRLPYET